MTQIAFWIGHGEDDGQDVGRGRESSGWSMANEFGSWKPEMWNSTIACSGQRSLYRRQSQNEEIQEAHQLERSAIGSWTTGRVLHPKPLPRADLLARGV